jgi:hypothetical protein
MPGALKDMENAVRKEAAAHGQNAAVAMSVLMAPKEAHHLHLTQVLRARVIGHLGKTALFLDLLVAANRHVRLNAAVDCTIAWRGYRFTGEIRTLSASPEAPAAAGMPQPTPPPSRPPTNLPEPIPN